MFAQHFDYEEEDVSSARDRGIKSYELVVRTIATVGNYGISHLVIMHSPVNSCQCRTMQSLLCYEGMVEVLRRQSSEEPMYMKLCAMKASCLAFETNKHSMKCGKSDINPAIYRHISS